MKIKLKKYLNSLGLILSIIGVIMIFIWGPPQPSFDTGIGIALEDQTVINDKGNTAIDYAKIQEAKKNNYQTNSRIGLVFVAVGFLAQFSAVWVPKKVTIFEKLKKKNKN